MVVEWLEWYLTALLALWFASTVAFQFWARQLKPFTSRFDIFRLLINWRLFSLTPGDIRLRYRDWSADGATGPWCEIPFLRSQRWCRVFWNPESIEPGTVSLLTMTYVTLVLPAPSESLQPQRFLAVYWWLVRSRPRPAASTHRQFQLMEVSLTRPAEEQVLYTSAFEPWPARAGAP